MTDFEIKIMGGIDISTENLAICRELLCVYEQAKKDANYEFFNTANNTIDTDEFKSYFRLKEFEMEVLKGRIKIIERELGNVKL